MKHSFDLISDLHVETWPTEFDWRDQATSPYCIVAGDVARDRDVLHKTLCHLGECYQAVFYIDGNDEHHGRYNDLARSYKELSALLTKIPSVVYLQDNVVILDDIAILGTNGWWSYDFCPESTREDVMQWWCERFQIESHVPKIVSSLSHTDAVYINRSLERLQHEPVRHIVVVTHTVPYHQLITHDIDLEHNDMFNVMGNTHMMSARISDVNEKLHTWCFGHYHGSIDQIHNGVRYINNCRGRHDTPWRQSVYYPRRLVITD